MARPVPWIAWIDAQMTERYSWVIASFLPRPFPGGPP